MPRAKTDSSEKPKRQRKRPELHPFEGFILNEAKEKVLEIYETMKPRRFNAWEIYRGLGLSQAQLARKQANLDIISGINLHIERKAELRRVLQGYYETLIVKMQRVNRAAKPPYTRGVETLGRMLNGVK